MAHSEFVRQRLRCPACAARIAAGDVYRCTNERCARSFPVIDGVPILIDEQRSIFTFSDFLAKKRTFFDPHRRRSAWRDALVRLLFDNSIDLRSRSLVAKFAEHVKSAGATPRVLVIGAGERPVPVDGVELVATDVSLTPHVSIICDAHDIPFDDETFDGVMAQAVLEHVADPNRCAEEMHRVLKREGIVFSDTPFMQQVHGGAYDFTRFTHLGHRRLFHRFEEIESGASSGPGVALTWSWRYFLLAFTTSRLLTRLLRVMAKVTSFWWKYFDRMLLDRPGALDGASGTYFIGRKSDTTITDREIVRSYRGMNQRF
jgi:SAM-dependent methyltransferase